MKSKLIILIALLIAASASAQNNELIKELIDEKTNLTLANDSLKRANKTLSKIISENQQNINNLQENIKEENAKSKALSKSILQLEKKRDSLDTALSRSSKKIKQKESQIDQYEQSLKSAKDNGRDEILSKIRIFYKDKSFDELLKKSSKHSIIHDRAVIGSNIDLEPLLYDLEHYFIGKELLVSKFDTQKIENALKALNSMDRESILIDKLKRNLQNYELLTEGMKELINDMVILDEQEMVSNMPREIQDLKLSKIMLKISYYIFNYEFNISDYPYLSDILLEIIQRKTPNPDADISDLLIQL